MKSEPLAAIAHMVTIRRHKVKKEMKDERVKKEYESEEGEKEREERTKRKKM
jgi:hypothetical protein